MSDDTFAFLFVASVRISALSDFALLLILALSDVASFLSFAIFSVLSATRLARSAFDNPDGFL